MAKIDEAFLIHSLGRKTLEVDALRFDYSELQAKCAVLEMENKKLKEKLGLPIDKPYLEDSSAWKDRGGVPDSPKEKKASAN